MTPNFVLQQNADYHKVWTCWLELLDQERTKDDLWRWQTRSWEEYCLLALMVAMIGDANAQIVASSPLWFRDENRKGRWIEGDPPLGVIHLFDAGLVVEVTNSDRAHASTNLGAPIWLRIGRLGDTTGFLVLIPVWPIWSKEGGLCHGELDEVVHVISLAKMQGGAVVIRPSTGHDVSESEEVQGALVITLGTEGEALRSALSGLTQYLNRVLRRSVA